MAIDTIPERWEASYFLGISYFTRGAFTGITEWESLSRNDFERALARGFLARTSARAPVELAVLAGDSAAVRRWSAAYLAAAPQGDDAPYVRWKTATYLGDVGTAGFGHGESSTYSERRAEAHDFRRGAQWNGSRRAMAAATELHRRAIDPKQLVFHGVAERELLLNLGRPEEALRRGGRSTAREALPLDPFFRVIEAIYWDGDSSAAATLARTAETRARLALAASGPPSRPQSMDVCTAALWRLRLGQLDGVDRFVKTLRAFKNPSRPRQRRSSRFAPRSSTRSSRLARAHRPMIVRSRTSTL